MLEANFNLFSATLAHPLNPLNFSSHKLPVNRYRGNICRKMRYFFALILSKFKLVKLKAKPFSGNSNKISKVKEDFRGIFVQLKVD